jgi:hypothetical protein
MSPSAEAALAELEAFEQGPWGQRSPTVAAAWRRVIPFFAFPPVLRRVIYTTNAIESINALLCKIIKTRGHFPNDHASSKLIWLALRNITADWGRAAHNWKEAMNQSRSSMNIGSPRPSRRMKTDLLTALVRPTVAVGKSQSPSNPEIRTLPSAKLAADVEQQHVGAGAS